MCKVEVAADKTRDGFEKLNAIILLQNSNIIPFKWSVQSYTCFYCDRQFKEVGSLKNHSLNEHTDNEKFENVVISVQEHKVDVYIKVDITSIKCIVCSRIFGNTDELRNHLETAHGKKFHTRYSLGLCPFRLSENEFRCGVCHERHNTFHTLNHHVPTHIKNYICEACGEGFHSAQKLRHHVIRHNSGFFCRFCQKSFRNTNTLRTHVDYVHNATRFQCSKCPKAFPVKSTLMAHYFSEHRMLEMGVKCDLCNSSFSRRQILLNHVRKDHLNERNHMCEVCEKSFFLKKDLTKHVLINHEKELKFQCKHCSKKFAIKKYLATHVRIHTNDRRCVCKECGAAFVQHTSLNYHIRRHHTNV